MMQFMGNVKVQSSKFIVVMHPQTQRENHWQIIDFQRHIITIETCAQRHLDHPTPGNRQQYGLLMHRQNGSCKDFDYRDNLMMLWRSLWCSLMCYYLPCYWCWKKFEEAGQVSSFVPYTWLAFLYLKLLGKTEVNKGQEKISAGYFFARTTYLESC